MDREQNHLDVMTDMVDRCYTPGQYHTTAAQDEEIAERLREAERRIEMGNLSEAMRLGLVRR